MSKECFVNIALMTMAMMKFKGTHDEKDKKPHWETWKKARAV
jgi:hypothetical protein